VAEVARARFVNANQVFTWRRAFELCELSESRAALIPTYPRLLQYLSELAVTKEASEMESEANHHAVCQRAYAMKKHRATRLHYDLRWNGTECY
jgi:hypothetical protein